MARKATFVSKSFGDARIEPSRYRRQGFPEAIYCPGKTAEQIVRIFGVLYGSKSPVLATRVDPPVASVLADKYRGATYHKAARLVTANAVPFKRAGPIVLVIAAGTSDVSVAEEAAVTLETLGRKVTRLYDVGVAGLHRLLVHLPLLKRASVAVVCAGMDGALPSVVGGLVPCPVIAVPTSVGYGAHLKGIASFLTMMNSCAANVSVVNIDNGFGAGVIASLISK